MALPPQFDEPALRGLRRLEAAMDRGQARVFRVLWFMVPPGSVAWNLQFQALLASRFLSDVAIQALLYGALIATARNGGNAIDAALLGVANLLPGVVLALYGGAVADAFPKRVVLAGAYLAMGLLCLLIPGLFGTGFGALLLILFAVRALHQLVQPSEASALPLVANHEELASATSFLSFASSAGEVVGKALLAPFIVVVAGFEPVVVIAGILFFLSSSRVFNLNTGPPREALEDDDMQFSTGAAVRYLISEPGVFWMLLLAALASTINVVLGILGPQYVQDVLNVEAAKAFYVFAPAPIGLVLALVLSPLLIRQLGERLVAGLGFAMVAGAMTALGLVDFMAGHFSWLLLIDIPGVGAEVEMAALLSVVLGAGVTFAASASQTYVSRNVPISIQGRTSALLGMMKDGLAIPALLLLGSIAGIVGVSTVITIAPALLLIGALWIDRYSSRWRVSAPPNRILG